MKYMLLIHGNPANWEHPMFLHHGSVTSEDERASMLAQFQRLMEEISGSGELISAEALPPPALTRTVRVRSRSRIVTDGPFAESKEQLAGFFIVECSSIERAVELAARFPDARFGAVEVRPIVD